jgi:SAM-dependent methyltransferase
MSLAALKMENVSCGVCRSSEARQFASGKDFEYHCSEDEFRMVECDECGNVYLNPRPTKEELGTIYPTNYYSYNYDTAINPLAIKAKDFLDQRKVKSWLRYVRTKSPRFMDVGCGNGRILHMLHKLGLPKQNLSGVEMHQGQMDRLNEEGYRGYNGRIEDVEGQLEAGSFDLIVMLQVLEHVEDPFSCVGSLARLLDKDGVLIVETPNTKSFDVRLFRDRYWGGYHFPRHWNLFSVQTLTRLASDHGLKVEAVNYLPAHSFWIFSLHHLAEERWKNLTLAKFFNPLQNMPLLSFFTAFDILRAKCGYQTSNVQVVLRKES